MSPEVLSGTIWIGIMAVAIVVEICTVNMVSIWFAGGALAASIAGYCGVSLPIQITIFMAGTVLLLLALRPLMKKRLKMKLTATNSEEMIGRKYKLLQAAGPGDEAGLIRIHDVEWRAITEDGSQIPADSLVEVVRIEGTKLVVTKA